MTKILELSEDERNSTRRWNTLQLFVNSYRLHPKDVECNSFSLFVSSHTGGVLEISHYQSPYPQGDTLVSV